MIKDKTDELWDVYTKDRELTGRTHQRPDDVWQMSFPSNRLENEWSAAHNYILPNDISYEYLLAESLLTDLIHQLPV